MRIEDFDPTGYTRSTDEMYPGSCPVCGAYVGNRPSHCFRLLSPVPGGRHSVWICTACRVAVEARAAVPVIYNPDLDPDALDEVVTIVLD